MKGLLIGLLYAIKGLYQLLATLLVVPFAVGYSNHPFSLAGQMSCGLYYYLAGEHCYWTDCCADVHVGR